MTYLTTEMIAKRLGFETAASVKGGDLHTMKECLERLGFTKVSKRINGVLSRSCWERKSFSVSSEDFNEKTDFTRNTVTTQSEQGFDPVTPLLHPPVTPVTDEGIGIETTNSGNSETVTVLHPPVTPPVTPSTPYTTTVSETVTVLRPQPSENLDLEIKTKIAATAEIEIPLPEANAVLLREALSEKNWEQIEELGKYWADNFGNEYRRSVWEQLSQQEQEDIKILKPGDVPEVDGIPILKTGNIVCVFNKAFKIKDVHPGHKLKGCFAREVETSIVLIADVKACDQSKLLDLKVKDKIKPTIGTLKGKTLTVSSFEGNIIWCKGQGRGATLRQYYSHQLEKI